MFLNQIPELSQYLGDLALRDVGCFLLLKLHTRSPDEKIFR
jgi:hypothetical protein